jgi:hypothetical protein
MRGVEVGTAFQRERAISRLTDSPFKWFQLGFSLVISWKLDLSLLAFFCWLSFHSGYMNSIFT